MCEAIETFDGELDLREFLLDFPEISEKWNGVNHQLKLSCATLASGEAGRRLSQRILDRLNIDHAQAIIGQHGIVSFQIIFDWTLTPRVTVKTWVDEIMLAQKAIDAAVTYDEDDAYAAGLSAIGISI